MDSSVSVDQKDKVTTILNQVSELSESEKHMLYLKLSDVHDESSKDPPTSMSRRSDLALCWIRTHYVEDRGICVPKQDVYEHYRQHCEASGNNPLSSFDFGKMMKLVFPNIHHRRLGQRGKSIYCYGGLRPKESIDSPSPNEAEEDEHQRLYALSCQLVCEWATQLLGRPFVDIRNLSEYLVAKGLSCGKTAAKFTLLSGSTSPPKLFDRDRKSPNSKHHDRQMLVQRKLQHNELIREHKEKLKQQQKQLQEQQSASAGCPRSPFSLSTYSLKSDEQVGASMPGVPGRTILPRPSSVQPYVRSGSSANVSIKQDGVNSFPFGLGTKRAALSELNKILVGVNTTFAGQTTTIDSASLSADVRESCAVSAQPKRCHSTSVVEKQSSSLLCSILEISGQVPEKCPTSAFTNSGCEMDEGKNSSFPALHNKKCLSTDRRLLSSAEGTSEGTSVSAYPPFSTTHNMKILEHPVLRTSADGLLMPQHPKRYGDNISPDRSSLIKRKCTTSLGVTKQQSLEASMVESENPDSEVSRTRPYSCPVSCGASLYECINTEVKSVSDRLISDLMNKSKLIISEENQTWKIVSHTTVTTSPATLNDNKVKDEKREATSEQQPEKNATLCHVVQKPTVINRPKYILHTVASCPDFKQAVTQGDVAKQVQESSTEKQPYNILNTLLSSDCDTASDTLTSVKTLQIPPLSASLAPSYLNNLTTETSKLGLPGSQLRLMTNPPHTVESPSILSSLSSRSAFVPVTSHKLQANSASKETDILMGVLSVQTQSGALIKKEGNDLFTSSAATSLQSVESINISSGHTLVKPVMTGVHISENSLIPTSNEHNEIKDENDISRLKFKKCSITVPSSSSSSSSSTLCQSGESTSSGCESLLTTPIPAVAAEKLDETLQVSLSTSSGQSPTVVSAAASNSPNCDPAAEYKPPHSVGCTTPVMSHHISPSSRSLQTRTTTTSPITPPKRASRNRFTPIRPKLGGGTNTPSPHKLGGTTAPSPQKKDMRPVSAILKEQRVKCAQDLLVNLASSYQGEVKLQMPAEFLGFSPTGKNKSADVHVTIKSPSNNTNILQPLTSSTPSHKEITVIVEPVSHSDSLPTTNPVLSSCLISATSAQLLQSFSQPLGVQVVPHNLCNSTVLPKPLFSPTFQDQSNQVPLNLSPTGSNTKVIILPSSASSLPLAQTVENSSSKPIIVEDDRGNKYSLDQKSECTVLPQNLQHLIRSSPAVDSLTASNSFTNSTSGLVNVSTIKGHVIGPDANGQTYLLVPNSEPVMSASSAPSLLCQQISALVTSALTPSVTGSNIMAQTDFSSVTTTGMLQPQVASSKMLLSEVNLLACSSDKDKSGQTLIQHNSCSSAFHKCPSSMHRRAENAGDNYEVDVKVKKQKDVSVSQNSNCEQMDSNLAKDVYHSEASRVAENSEQTDTASHDRQVCEEASSSTKSQGKRKRKASKGQDDEPENRKRLNSSRCQNGDDDDVFIVKIEDSVASKSANENVKTAATAKPQCLDYPPSSKSLSEYEQTDYIGSTAQSEEAKAESKKTLADTETLLKMIENSKSMTVKETIKALNELRARQNQIVSKSFDVADDPLHKDKPVLRESLSCQELKLSSHEVKFKDQMSVNNTEIRASPMGRSHSVHCSSVSPHPPSEAHLYTVQQDSTCSVHPDISKVQRTERRHISLNLESLESDALLDTEPALDHRLVGDIREVTSRKSDQRTSIGVAAKSAKSVGLLLSLDGSADMKFNLKQHKRDRACEMTLLSDRKLGKVFSCESQKEKSQSYVLNSGSESQNNTTSQDSTSQGSRIVMTDTQIRTSLGSVQRRSMSCVRDILQRDAKHDFTDSITPDIGKIKTDSKINQSASIGSKASEHPFLAQFLSKPSGSLLDVRVGTDNNQTTPDCLSAEKSTLFPSIQNDSDVGFSKSDVLENELPVDIADFITESMSVRSSLGCDSFKGNTLSALLADLVQNGQNEREQICGTEEHIPVWRSLSVPNTVPDICYKSRRDNHKISSKNYPPVQARSQSVADCVGGPDIADKQKKQNCKSEPSSVPPSLSWENSSDAHKTINSHCNSENMKEKDMSSEDLRQTSDGSISVPSGTFLSPIGPAKLTRRSSVERSASGDRNMTKTPVECLVSKSSTERSLPRMRTPVDRNMTKTPVDRLLTKTPIDRSMNITPIERHSRKAGRDKSPTKTDNFSKDLLSATVLHQAVKGRESHKHSGVISKLPTERVLNNLLCDSLFNQGSEDVLTHHGSVDSVKGDRSLNQTPMSDAGYSSVSQTPVSDVGYSSVSPSPIMMSVPGLFGECGRRDLTSPATIFMPLRSDSAMNTANNGRGSDGTDSYGLSLQSLISYPGPQSGCITSSSGDAGGLNKTRQEENSLKNETDSSKFGQDIISYDSSLLQDVIDGTLFDSEVIKDDTERSIKKTSEDHILKHMSSLADFEKFMSAQLNCIPTPPRSPSTSPQHPADINPSPLPFSMASSYVLPPHSHQSWAAAVSSHHTSQFSTVTTTSSHVACLPSNNLHIVSSPGSISCSDHHSSNAVPNISQSPCGTTHPCSSPHQYNPHPSPPFTPSSQRCLASPRCRTPCSHRSLMSPGCATPSGDLSSAPNRFMPIQTSGILATSLAPTQTYIQPIRPVVTLASMANQRSHTSLVFSHSEDLFMRMPLNKINPRQTEHQAPPSSVMCLNNFDQSSSTLLKSDVTNVDAPANSEKLKVALKNSEEDIDSLQRKVGIRQRVHEDHKHERSSHPALILSLTGSIGSVSGQGMKSGWRKGISGQVSPSSVVKKGHSSSTSACLPLLAQCKKSCSDKSSSLIAQEHASELLSQVPPAYGEAASSLAGPENIVENLVSSNHIGKEVPGPSSHDHKELTWNICGADVLQIVNNNENRYEHRQPLSIHIDAPSQTNNSLKSSLQGDKDKMLMPNINNISTEHSDFPFSVQLAKLSGQSETVFVEQQSQAAGCKPRHSASVPPQKSLQDKCGAAASSCSSLSVMLQAPAFPSFQSQKFGDNSHAADTDRSKPFQNVCDLPTAYYAGTAPNVDLTKTPFALVCQTASVAHQPSVGLQHSRSEAQLEAYLINLSSHLDRRLDYASGNQDDLGETLNVLKSLDSQYFQADDEDSKSPETVI